MEEIRQNDRVQVVGMWPDSARGYVKHITTIGDMAYVVFDKVQQANEEEDHNWYEYNWYTEEHLLKIESLKLGDRVEIIAEWPIGVMGTTGQRSNDMIWVTFDQEQDGSDGGWYREAHLNKIV